MAYDHTVYDSSFYLHSTESSKSHPVLMVGWEPRTPFDQNAGQRGEDAAVGPALRPRGPVRARFSGPGHSPPRLEQGELLFRNNRPLLSSLFWKHLSAFADSHRLPRKARGGCGEGCCTALTRWVAACHLLCCHPSLCSEDFGVSSCEHHTVLRKDGLGGHSKT